MDCSPPKVSRFESNPKDLETVVVVIQLAAIDLTPAPRTVFSKNELLSRIRDLGGAAIDPKDVAIVLANSKFLEKVRGGWVLR